MDNEVELMNIPRPFHELSDKECRIAYWKLYNELLRKQIAYTEAKTEFDCIRHVCIDKGLRIKKGRKWVWNEEKFREETCEKCKNPLSLCICQWR